MTPSLRARPAARLPLRMMMGSAVGVAFAQGAAGQTPTTQDSAVRLQPINVDGTAGRGDYQATAPALPKLTQPLLDTPQSVNVIPRQLMDDQGIRDTRDALRTVPGVSLAAGEAGAQGDNLTLRGFTARNDFFLDGMRDFGSYYRDPFDLESIEVLKGPSSVLFGRGSTGGVVHQVSKQPGLAPITAGSVSFGTDGTKRLTADVNRAIDGVPNSAVRLNVMANQNDVAGRTGAEYNRFGFAPSVAFGLGTDTRLTLNYLHQQEYDTPDYGLPWLYSRPAPVKSSTFYGFKDRDYLRTDVDVFTAKLEHDFSDSFSVRTQARYGSYGRAARITEPQIVYGGVTPATPLANIRVTRNMIATSSTETLADSQTDFTARFDTGVLKHTVTGGFEFGQETSRPVRYTYTGLATTSLLYPNASDPFTGIAAVRTRASTTSNMLAAYVLDTIKLGEHWELTAGVRWDRFETDYSQTVAPSAVFHRTDSMPSTRAALTYKPIPSASIYVSYGTSFNPSAESLTLATNTADLAPEKNESYEFGGKWDVLGERLSLTGAVFQIEKTNARVPDPTNSAFNILGGDQRVRGFELGASGRVTDKWQVQAGYAFLDSVVVKSTIAGSVGKPLANTPQNTFSVWTTYTLDWHDLQLGGGVQYVDSRLASTTANATTGAFLTAPGYATVQGMVKLPVREGLDLQVNGYNLTNTKYYDLLHPAHVVPGAGRSVLFSANFKL